MSLLGTSTLVLPQTGGDLGLADQGAFYAGTTTDNTGIVGPVSTTLDKTKGLLSVYNTHATKNIYPRYLRLIVYTVGTGGTRLQFTQTIDSGPTRYSSGGTALTMYNTDMTAASDPIANVYFGALTLAAASTNERVLHNTVYRNAAIEVVSEVYQFSWGGPGQFEDPASLINNTTTLSHITFAYAPVKIGPGHSFTIHQWRASITVGITFGVEFGFVAK